MAKRKMAGRKPVVKKAAKKPAKKAAKKAARKAPGRPRRRPLRRRRPPKKAAATGRPREEGGAEEGRRQEGVAEEGRAEEGRSEEGGRPGRPLAKKAAAEEGGRPQDPGPPGGARPQEARTGGRPDRSPRQPKKAGRQAIRPGPGRQHRPHPRRHPVVARLSGGSSSSARTGREELLQHIKEHNETSPAITAGDVDADWQLAYSSGDEAPGGDNPTPDQDVVDEIGEALGVNYEDGEELKGAAKIEDRDKHRWELDPASKDDFDE